MSLALGQSPGLEDHWKIIWFSRWLAQNGFGVIKPKTRSWAIALYENADQITKWRDSLPERQRRRLKNPQAVVYRWRVATQGNGYHCPADWVGEARAAWRKFLTCVAMLPEAEATALWSMVRNDEAATASPPPGA